MVYNKKEKGKERERKGWVGCLTERRFCWFSNDEKVGGHIEKNFEFFSSVMLNVHRATDLMFSREYELEEARSFSRKLLEKYASEGNGERSFLKTMIKHELSVPRIARLDHLEHRMWIEDKDINSLWAGKTSFHRWDGKSLNGHCKAIFGILDDLEKEIAAKHLHSQGSDITNHLQHLGYETFVSWLVEAKWSRSQCVPSMEEYLAIGMTSVAHTIVLPLSCFLTPSIRNHQLQPNQYETPTKLLMFITRLSNDIQRYQEEEEQGKLNTVLLYLNENPKADIEDSIAYVKGMLETKKKELLQHAVIDGLSDLPKHCKQLHLSCLKVFAMFFHSSNRCDKEDTEMLKGIQQAICSPLLVGRTSKVLTN
ncbi:hypothetical protein SLEP1_g57657 [Rubroshorea leprosula]|uniref:Terpene synthase metal-binding domain-containing protein n=1 Tax=Rubroshorea leprosula TaxID=152421 RepID=A0AAV5MPR8_9ROSI|nr:hypothetical protein SLEP1_g57657 [Rubroshorea leprosula]